MNQHVAKIVSGTFWLLLISAIFLIIPEVTNAATFENPLALRFIIEILKGFVLSVIYVGTPALVVFIIWTGFLFASSMGNPDKLTKAKATALQAIIGGIVLLSLWAIVKIVGNTLAGLSSASLLIILSAFFIYILYKK